MKRILVAVLAATLVCGMSLTLPANAETEEPVLETIVDEYSYTSSVSSSLGFNGCC